MNMWAHKQKQKAFTIVELLIVIVVIAILAAIAIIAYNGVTQRARTSTLDSHLQDLITKSELYNVDNSAYPASISDISGSTSNDFYVFAGNRYCVSSSDSTGLSRYKYSDNSSSGTGTCWGIAPTYATAPENCFGFDSSAHSLTAYYQYQANSSSNPACPSEFTVPSTIGGVSVLTTNVSAFLANQYIKSVRLASTMTSVGIMAFQDSNLSYIYIPSSVTSIGPAAFYNTKLTSIVIPASVSTVGPAILAGNTSLRSLSIGMDSTPSSLDTTLDAGQFSGDTSLRRAEIGGNIIKLGGQIFDGCILQQLVFQEGSRDLTIGPFLGSPNTAQIQTLTLPSRVITIDSNAFNNISTLKKLTIAEGTKPLTITSSAFYSTGLTSVTLPGRTSLITYGAFAYNASLTQLTINEGSTPLTINNGAFYTTGLSTIKFPHQTILLGSGAFTSSATMSVSVPSSATVESGAFPVGTSITTY